MTTVQAPAPPALGTTTSLAYAAYERIRDRLIMLDIRPGEPINDGRLAESLGFGRTPVREALKRLETDHLVVSYARRGTFATAVDVTELGAISDLRQQLEPFAAHRAATAATEPMRAALRAMSEKVRALEASGDDRSTLMRLDMSVHRMIYRATGNKHLEDVLIRYDNLATRIWCLVVDKLPDLASHISEHAQLLDAIADGDSERAELLTREHIDSFATEVRRVL
ncbi:GntR family transcriptional regulator [Nocardioides sp.]|uniref:GntR family transcriptional regulator n=1 Tax=Nocardioides sp. TaxID=35761 RepID=UPI0019835FF6|nr:GntR family transcriptional regulator [Nocardioides sp.]MBC7279548.1 GntR family transcriptional regulator [Nocardioides sp.]